MTIDKGTRDGAPARHGGHRAGRRRRTGHPAERAHAAKVQLLIDRNAAAGALVERSRAQGVVVGAGERSRCAWSTCPRSADVAVGDTVVTSGIDGIYPKGFVIGRIERVERSGGAFSGITIRPAVDFSASRKCWSC